MGKRYLIDTSAISKYLSGHLSADNLKFMAEIMEIEILFSFISQIELKSWNISDEELISSIENILNESIIFGITDEIINKTIEIRRKTKIKLPDAIIAATAIVNKLTLLSCNDVDFLKVPKLKYHSLT